MSKYPTLDEIEHINEIVDVSCAEKGDVFIGNPLQREKVTMKLSTFVEGCLYMQAGRSHWFEDTDLMFYLSQCCVYSNSHKESVTVTGLEGAVEIPPCIHQSLVYQINIWLNALACRSSLHYDRNHNLLYVAKGMKTVTLFAPRMTPQLSACSAFSSAPNHSTLSFETAEQLVTINLESTGNGCRCVVNDGDALFIPEGWWHQVASDTCTYAINFWFASSLKVVFEAGMECYMLRAALQQLVHENMIADSDQCHGLSTNSSIKCRKDSKRKIDTESDANACVYHQKSFSTTDFAELIDSIIRLRTIVTGPSPVSDRADDATGHPASDDYIALLNIQCLRFVDCDYEYMKKYWLPFAWKVR